MVDKGRATNPEKELASFFAKYDPATVKLGKALRSKLRARLPGLNEIVYVYENQNSLVIAYSPTEGGGSDALCGMALYPGSAKLFFNHGARLSKSDPNKLLQGRGTVRHVVLNSAADFDRAEIEVLLAAAVQLAKLRLDPSAKGSMIIKAEAQKQRALRAKKAARPTSTRRKPAAG